MIANSSKVLLIVLISSLLLVALDADNEDCTTELRVRRNTNHEVISGQNLRIDCPVLFCNNPPPKVTWYKIEDEGDRLIIDSSNRIKIGWEEIKPLEGVSFLIFQKILRKDSGGYGCESEGSVSHVIHIKVIENIEVTNKTNKGITNDTNNHPKTEPRGIFWMFVYSAGIGSFVIMVVIISGICKLGCKGKSRKDKQTDQWIEIPRTSRENEPLHGQRMQERNRQRDVTQGEDSSVVYAALNHRPPQREALWPQRQTEETEYSAIRQV